MAEIYKVKITHDEQNIVESNDKTDGSYIQRLKYIVLFYKNTIDN